MELMNIRRMMLQMIGGDSSVWKQKQITAQQGYSNLGDIKSWIDNEIPTSDNIWVIKEQITQGANYQFLGTFYIFNTNTYHIRRMNNGSLNTAGTNTLASSEWVEQGDTFTIFYQ